ncbi:hypothetical protein [Actinophytocola gossypii]|uniref:PH domain-containing protein n=1 Tax=Actinophytocola gossypii TaxID=2812003 RepID=A0ABT2J578_9PSEU|nr:hypothetical protein [Actinophytocola gossypii]MCT2582640.1 hypothetical protein [Actinophytocola gossypii]
MRVSYNPVWAVTTLVVGAGCFVLGLWVTLLGDFSPLVFIGPLLVLLGILQFARPYFLYDAGTRTIAVKALLGPATRRFGGSEGTRLIVDVDRIAHVTPDGRTKKVPVSRAMSKRDDWNAVLADLS